MSQLQESATALEAIATGLPHHAAEQLKYELEQTATRIAGVVEGTAHEQLISDVQGGADEVAELIHERLNLTAARIRDVAMTILTCGG